MEQKCVYCNSSELTVSDIIPFALTGAKFRAKIVCQHHNSFTNLNYESKFIKQLAFIRNALGLKERDGSDVIYKADITLDGHVIKNVAITTRASFYGDQKRLFHPQNEENTLIRNRDKLLHITGATPDTIRNVDIATGKQEIHFALDVFISSESLHTVAKIAYEAHCCINKIEGYEEERYKDIVSYILDPSCLIPPVEIVNDGG